MPKRVLAGVKEARDWWRSKVASYESRFFASAVTDLSPTVCDSINRGRMISAVFERGIRVYCFELQADRDRFTSTFRKAYNARPVGKDPCP